MQSKAFAEYLQRQAHVSCRGYEVPIKCADLANQGGTAEHFRPWQSLGYLCLRAFPGKGKKLPNNWDSLFEGKAWAWDEVRQEYYMHLFAIQQADLNMDNPLVREEVKKILKFWLDLGVDGFREDVITFISKKEGLPDDYIMPASKGFNYFNHGPHLHEYLEEFNRDVFSKYNNLYMVLFFLCFF